MMMDLKEKFGIRYILISKEIGEVREIKESVEVIYRGNIVEEGKKEEVLDNKRNDYKREMVDEVKKNF